MGLFASKSEGSAHVAPKHYTQGTLPGTRTPRTPESGPPGPPGPQGPQGPAGATFFTAEDIVEILDRLNQLERDVASLKGEPYTFNEF